MANTTASERTHASLPPVEGVTDIRSQRARMERMAVTPLGGGVYEIESQSGNTYSVDLPGGRCTCPDHNFRGVRCKHLRRVAMEVTEGRVPPPGQQAVTCRNCGDERFVDETDRGPHFCEECGLDPGETVVDRETGDLLVVVRTTSRRADEVEITGHGCTVAEYSSNAAYRPDDVVVEAMYPVPAGLGSGDLQPRHLRRYSFPRGRLARRREDVRPAEREDQSALDDFEATV
ncbi:TFIIB-type zinc ribbon-containing protein [Halorussus gelatinilyticus]|uniref:TFIIB-type zinc ribbon-containing protein n=1 Tax=Halorussus gelatinilyticus TaxID=2937524 RepID=A0A8U0IM30_9EURY|nr:TFIIB-type zinc ribbon-containing protein [Halorussus gelatinilyticus]UPW01432.1 TFIIB-type zinc ribbon-containing protein [Halorussus gelatinilyticus]